MALIRALSGGGGSDRYDCTIIQNVAGNTPPTFTTKGKAKAIWMIYGRGDGGQFTIMTNVNPTTGVIDNNDLYYQTQNNGSVTSWTSLSSNYFTVSDNAIAFSGNLSTNTRYACVAYTY